MRTGERREVTETDLGVAGVTRVGGGASALPGVGGLAGHAGADLAGEAAGEGALTTTLGTGTVRPALVQRELAAVQQEPPSPPLSALESVFNSRDQQSRGKLGRN